MTKVRGLMNRSHPLVVVLLRELLLVLNPFAPGDARNYALSTAFSFSSLFRDCDLISGCDKGSYPTWIRHAWGLIDNR